MMKLGDYLDQLCWSQADLARAAGVSESSVKRALVGQKLQRRTAHSIMVAIGKATGKPVQANDVDLRIVPYRRRKPAVAKVGPAVPVESAASPGPAPLRKGKAEAGQ